MADLLGCGGANGVNSQAEEKFAVGRFKVVENFLASSTTCCPPIESTLLECKLAILAELYLVNKNAIPCGCRIFSNMGS